MCAVWRCGGPVLRLRCRMVFRLRRFSAFPAHILAVGLFRLCFRLFRPLCCVLSLRADAVAACAVSSFLPSDISAEIVAAFFDGRLLPLQRAVFRGFPKGRLLARKRWSFAARKDTFCTLKGHLLESGFRRLRHRLTAPVGAGQSRASAGAPGGHNKRSQTV